MSPTARVFLWVAVALSFGCAHPMPGRLPVCSVDKTEVQGPVDHDFVRRFAYHARGQDVDARLEVVVEKRGATVAVVGFNELGVKAFSGLGSLSAVEFENHLGPLLVVPPETVFADLRRVEFFQGGDVGVIVAFPHRSCGWRSRIELISDRSL